MKIYLDFEKQDDYYLIFRTKDSMNFEIHFSDIEYSSIRLKARTIMLDHNFIECAIYDEYTGELLVSYKAENEE